MWHHVVATLDASKAQMMVYKNGKLAGTAQGVYVPEKLVRPRYSIGRRMEGRIRFVVSAFNQNAFPSQYYYQRARTCNLHAMMFILPHTGILFARTGPSRTPRPSRREWRVSYRSGSRHFVGGLRVEHWDNLSSGPISLLLRSGAAPFLDSQRGSTLPRLSFRKILCPCRCRRSRAVQ